MSTKDVPENRDAGPLLGLGSSEGLGPLPAPDMLRGVDEDYYSAATVRSYALQERAAERERWLEAATAASRELCHCVPWSAAGQAFAALRALIDGPNAKVSGAEGVALDR